MKAKLQSDLNNLSNWLCANKLKLNAVKTKYILFNKDGISPQVHLEVDGESICGVKSMKFLGIYLDSNLSFIEHYSNLHTKLLKSAHVIKSLSKFVPEESLRVLYFAYYHSHLVYGLPIW